MGLVRSLQPWDILLIYCDKQLKKYIAPLLRLARGTLAVPFLMSMSEDFSIPFYPLIKLCYTKALEWSSLVPDPEAKSSSEITNSTSFTLSYHNPIDYTVHGILQARILEWVAIPFSRGSSQPRDQTQGSLGDLPHCRRILYQLSHQGSPKKWMSRNSTPPSRFPICSDRPSGCFAGKHKGNH